MIDTIRSFLIWLFEKPSHFLFIWIGFWGTVIVLLIIQEIKGGER